ncbi:MAG: hypothetical protein PHF97_10460, partial [Bacteroidales bacterium]|nr:hypothetical protein [Bacteroidales bacterium]
MMGFKKWQRAELLIFTLVVIANLLPFISTKFFPSLDGASHLSNSNIINQLVVYHNALFKQFFMLNPEPVPNWTTYVFLSLFNLILPAFLAEKILLIIIIGGMPFAFRSLMITISPNNRFYSYLIFPFTHSMFLFFGFYNFCISILFFLITLNYWIKNEEKPWHLKKTILLTLLIVITYFSHIVVFGALLISIALRILTNTSAGLLCKTEDKKTIFRNFLNHTLTITLAALIPLILFFYFFYSRPGTRQITFIAREELIKFIVTVRPLISFNPILEGKITTLIFYLLVTLLGIGVLAFLIFSIVKLFRKNNNLPFLPTLSWWWLAVSSGVFLFLYFSLPDAYGTASYTNLRFGFVFFLIFILWISTFR